MGQSSDVPLESKTVVAPLGECLWLPAYFLKALLGMRLMMENFRVATMESLEINQGSEANPRVFLNF